MIRVAGPPRYEMGTVHHLLTTIVLGTALSVRAATAILQEDYNQWKQALGTNVIEIAWRLDPRTGRLIVMSAEDNIVKGASGQAVQSMNVMCGFPETSGLM